MKINLLKQMAAALILMLWVLTPLNEARADDRFIACTENPLPVADSLRHYLDFSQDDFSRLNYMQGKGKIVSSVQIDSEGRITAVRREIPDDPGIGTLLCQYTYDEEGRFTDILLQVENAEHVTRYGLPATRDHASFFYKQDGSIRLQFEYANCAQELKGEIIYDTEGKPASGTLIYERIGMEKGYERIDVDYSDPALSYDPLEIYGILTMEEAEDQV